MAQTVDIMLGNINGNNVQRQNAVYQVYIVKYWFSKKTCVCFVMKNRCT